MTMLFHQENNIQLGVLWRKQLSIGLEISWKNSGLNEVGYVKKISDKKNKILKDGDEIIRIDPNYFRPTEVDSLLGDSSKAKKELGWEPKISFDQLIEEMMQNDMSQAKKEVILKKKAIKLTCLSNINSVFIAGHKGMVGSAIKRNIEKIFLR